jgi:hypothetical protein
MKISIKPLCLLLALGCSLLSGCAPSVAFSPAKNSSVHGASVVKRSQYPERDQVMIYTFGQNLSIALGSVGGAVGSAIGSAVSHAAGGGDRSQFLAFMKAHKVDPGLIMAGAFENELKKAPLWPPPPRPATPPSSSRWGLSA